MTALLLSYVCDFCDGLSVKQQPVHKGYVVYRGNGGVRLEYVFRSRRSAARWRSLRQLEACEIREVVSAHQFRWRTSTRPLQDVELADQLVEVYPNQNYEPGPNRAHLA